jgi:hypothetical protein
MAGFLLSCSPRTVPVPPATPVLARSVIGYGVVTVSYARVLTEPGPEGIVLGYVRAGTILRALERRLVQNGETVGYWILIDGEYKGWLPQEELAVYNSEERAETAAENRGGG